MQDLRHTGCRIIAINDAFRLAPWADLLYFADRRWWDGPQGRQSDVERSLVARIVTCSDAPGCLHLRNTGIEGFEPAPGNIRTGNNSGYQAIHLAIHLGVSRIVLFGYDMRVSGHQTHWGERPEGHTPEDFARTLVDLMLPLFRGLVRPLADRGIEVTNASPGSALTLWPVVGHQEGLAALKLKA